MTPEEMSRLAAGSRVWWNDPDEELCSRYFTIDVITTDEDGEFTLFEPDGTVLQGYSSELSLTAPYEKRQLS